MNCSRRLREIILRETTSVKRGTAKVWTKGREKIQSKRGSPGVKKRTSESRYAKREKAVWGRRNVECRAGGVSEVPRKGKIERAVMREKKKMVGSKQRKGAGFILP